MFEYFKAIWYIWRLFSNYVVIQYIFSRLGCLLYQDKSGNPDRDFATFLDFYGGDAESVLFEKGPEKCWDVLPPFFTFLQFFSLFSLFSAKWKRGATKRR
jgi:hypothetical protein